MQNLSAWALLLQFLSVCLALQHTSVRPAIGGVKPDAGVVIVGGGFGGLYTALKLRALSPTTQVKLVDPKDHFVFLPLLYELAVGSASAIEDSPPFTKIYFEALVSNSCVAALQELTWNENVSRQILGEGIRLTK